MSWKEVKYIGKEDGVEEKVKGRRVEIQIGMMEGKEVEEM